jgi:hypothetical protein
VAPGRAPRVGFVVTNLKRPAERVVKFYNGRGTAEKWIREHPEMTPLQRMQEARARCVFEMLQATTAITKAKELAQWGAVPPTQEPTRDGELYES